MAGGTQIPKLRKGQSIHTQKTTTTLPLLYMSPLRIHKVIKEGVKATNFESKRKEHSIHLWLLRRWAIIEILLMFGQMFNNIGFLRASSKKPSNQHCNFFRLIF